MILIIEMLSIYIIIQHYYFQQIVTTFNFISDMEIQLPTFINYIFEEFNKIIMQDSLFGQYFYLFYLMLLEEQLNNILQIHYKNFQKS